MIRHPLLLSVLIMDSLCVLLALGTAFAAFRIVLDWTPGSPTREQIKREIEFESASIKAGFSIAAFGISSFILIIGLTNILPAIVPGAMCGTGVLQATETVGVRALIFRFLAIGAMFYTVLLARLNRRRPDAPLTPVTVRVWLLLMPILFLAVTDTCRAFSGLATHQPVDCCAAVYDQIRTVRAAGSPAGPFDSYRVWGFAAASVMVSVCGLMVWLSKSAPRRWLVVSFSIFSLAWVPIAFTSLVGRLAAYHYEVLHHHCPWCLFLPEHRLVGYPLFAALLTTAIESLAPAVCAKTSQHFPTLEPYAVRRARLAGLRVTMAVLLFGAVAGLPPIIWRLRFGVWMGQQ